MLQKNREHTEPTIEWVTITPDMAMDWLCRNTHNRELRQSIVDKYTRDIESGNFELTGDTIKFCEDGSLLDGQHRLWAIIQANHPVRTAVVMGLKKKTQSYMDIGRRRSAADALGLNGHNKTSRLSALARVVYTEARDTTIYSRNEHTSPTTSEILEVVEDIHPTLQDYILSSKFPRGIQLTTLSFLNYVGSVGFQRPLDTEEFIEHIKHGSGPLKAPGRAYRERVISAALASKPLVKQYNYWTLLRAFNMHMAGDWKRLFTAKERVKINGLDLNWLRTGERTNG